MIANLHQGGDGVEMCHPPQNDTTVVEVVEVLLTVGPVAGEGKVLQDKHIILSVELTEVAPGGNYYTCWHFR